MKKFKQLSFIVAVALLLNGAGPLRSLFAATTYFDVALQVNVSSQPAAPTLLLAAINAPYADVRIICTQYNLAGENILLSSSASGFNTSVTTGTARVPCLPPTVQQLDIFLDNYSGPLYAVANATYTIPVTVFRKR